MARATDTKPGLFRDKDPKRIASSLKASAEQNPRRHPDPYRSALSMLQSYIEHAGAQLQPLEKNKLEKAKEELKALYQRPTTGKTTALGRKVEKPGHGKQGGPSGQTDGTRDRKHANK